MEQTPFQAAANTSKSRWEWLEEKVPVKDLRDGNCGSDGAASAYPGPFGAELEKAIAGKPDDERVSRPEHGVFGLAMLGGGRVFGKAHLYGEEHYSAELPRRRLELTQCIYRLPVGQAWQCHCC